MSHKVINVYYFVRKSDFKYFLTSFGAFQTTKICTCTCNTKITPVSQSESCRLSSMSWMPLFVSVAR